MIIEELKNRARVLHKKASAGDAHAQRRMRQLPELAEVDERELAGTVKRRHGLSVIARELGFDGWPHLVAALEGQELDDYGTLLHSERSYAHSNIWSVDYEEARRIRKESGGYLLAWRRQFLVVDRHYVETLGLDPDHPAWASIGRDWVRPADKNARTALYSQLIAQRSDAA